jgi:hypothetical protein
VDAELVAGCLGGPLAAEALAYLLSVLLIRHVLALRQTPCRRYGTLPERGSAHWTRRPGRSGSPGRRDGSPS